MQQLPLDQLVLIGIQTALLVALIARIWSAELYRVYPYFFSYLVADLLQILILSPVPFRGVAYPYFWVSTGAMVVCFSALIVVELYRVIFRDLPGIASVSRRYMKITVAVGILVSLFLFHFEETPANYVSMFLVIERGIDFSLVLFILLITGFLTYYPVSLNRNVVVYSIGYAFYFLIKATALFVRTMGNYVAPQISTVLMVVFPLCLLFWLLGLNRQGETRTVVIGHKWNTEDEERLLSQIKAINANLMRDTEVTRSSRNGPIRG
jgi:hypothetical protein